MDKKLLRTIYNICVLILLVIGAWLVVNHFVHFGDGEFTDNATVQQHHTRQYPCGRIHQGDTIQRISART